MSRTRWTRQFHNTKLKGRGRHDPCVLPRAVPMVEAMTALVLVDHALRHKAQCGMIFALSGRFLIYGRKKI